MEIIPEKIAVRLTLEDVPDRLEFRMRGKSAKMLADVSINKRHPAHDSGNELGLVRERKKPVGFRQHLSRLNHHRGIDSGGGCRFFQLGDKVILRQRRAGRNPIVVLRRVIPKMVVGIDHSTSLRVNGQCSPDAGDLRPLGGSVRRVGR